MKESADGKFVVIENGQRVTSPLTEEEANAEAEKRKAAIQEKQGESAAKVEVKRNLFG